MTIVIKKPKVVILDIEGTAAPHDFFEKSLLPYLQSNLANYISENYTSEVIKDSVSRLSHKVDRESAIGFNVTKIPTQNNSNGQNVSQAVADNILRMLYDNPKMSKVVVSICLLVWADGFKSGSLKGHVFNDVPAFLRNLRADGIRVVSLSLYLMEIQEMMFLRSKYGNLDQFFDGYCCTDDYGSKNNRETFYKIARKLQQQPKNILFVTNNQKEGDVAKSAGMEVLVIYRKEKTSDRYVTTFRDILWGQSI
jgi:enolase-phosphatase E1